MKTKTIKPSKDSKHGMGSDVTIDVTDDQLVIKWLCGGIYRFRAKEAHDQFERLCLIAQYDAVNVGDRDSSGQRYYGHVSGGKFTGFEYDRASSERGSVSWEQFKRAITAALKEIPVPEERETEVVE